MYRRKFITNTTLTLAAIAVTNALFANSRNNIFEMLKNENHSMLTDNSQIITTTYVAQGKEVKVHAIQTGLISVKTNFLNRKGSGIFSKVNILFGHTFADFMPIWVWVIEHPEGILLIDTGDIEEADHKEFYKHENLNSKFNLFAMSNKRKINKEDEINNQLARINIKPEQISKVILTHLHGDHTDGLKFFPTNEILVNESEHKHPYSNLPTTYPKWFKPTLFNFSKDKIDIFNNGYPLTKCEDLWLVPTQGHTHNHCSILFKTDKEHILFAGDTSYNQQQLIDNIYPGSNIDIRQSKETYQLIKNYAAKYPTIYLPSHDHFSGDRLQNRELLTTK